MKKWMVTLILVGLVAVAILVAVIKNHHSASQAVPMPQVTAPSGPSPMDRLWACEAKVGYNKGRLMACMEGSP